MSRIAVISGSRGALFEALDAELSGRGWQARWAPFGAAGRDDLAAAARGAEALFHVGVRTPSTLAVEERMEIEAGAAYLAGRAALGAPVRRFVLLSTVSVYGRPRNLPCPEGDLKRPRSAFERARWRAEQAAWTTFRQGAPLTVLRPALAYGPTLRGGPMRALALAALFNAGRRRVPIIRRGPVAHLVHLRDVARAAAHVAELPDDRSVVGRAFNVADDAPLPLAEHLAAAIEAMGHAPGRVLPYSPRLAAFFLGLVRSVPDRILLEPLNRWLAAAWRRLAASTGTRPDLVPRLDREILHWMSADHYYDTRRLRDLGWSPAYPVSVDALPETIRGLLDRRLLPGGPGALPDR